VEITINTPALLFPATSLLMISYTTRFLHLANLVRSLHALKPVFRNLLFSNKSEIFENEFFSFATCRPLASLVSCCA